jgi:hypothetical protein
MNLYEKRRPTSLADVKGQDKAVKIISRLIQNGAGGALFLDQRRKWNRQNNFS